MSPIIDPTIVQNITNYFQREDQRNREAQESGIKKMLASFFKSKVLGSKVIRIEIYNAESFANIEQSICNCNAELCAQHVVEDIHADNIYPRVRDIIKCMDNTFYVSL